MVALDPREFSQELKFKAVCGILAAGHFLFGLGFYFKLPLSLHSALLPVGKNRIFCISLFRILAFFIYYFYIPSLAARPKLWEGVFITLGPLVILGIKTQDITALFCFLFSFQYY